MKTILLATDFSKTANNACDYAIELAKYFDANLILVNAYNYTFTQHESALSFNEFVERDREANKALADLKEKIFKKNSRIPHIECYAHAGNAFDVIQSAADKFNAELVVIGITGSAGKLKEHVVGSTALAVARNLDINTIIIPEDVRYHRIHKVSFACDLENIEEGDLVYAAKYFSKIFDARLEIINVEKFDVKTQIYKSQPLSFLNKNLETVDHNTITIENNDPATALENYFRTHDTDILMVNPKKHNVFYNLFHSVTKKLVFHSKQPLLIIH